MRFVVCETPEQVRVAQRVRYDVFCIEKGWIDPALCPDGTEADEWDEIAIHFLAFDEDTALGTVRLLLGSKQDLPATPYLDLASLGLVPHRLVEVSRLATKRSCRSQDLRVFLGLTMLMWEWATEQSVDAWLAIADVPLVRLFERIGLPIVATEPEIDYLGSRCVPLAVDLAGTGPALMRRGAVPLLATAREG
jgi:N-acyl-L-homoserine lactone synthetase